MSKYKYLVFIVALFLLLPSIAFGAELLVPDEIVRYSEYVDTQNDGAAVVDVEVQIVADSAGTYILPLGDSKAEDFKVISPSSVTGSIVSDKGVKYIGLTFSDAPKEDTVVQMQYTNPEYINFNEAKKDNLGRVRVNYAFQNSISTSIDLYELTLMLPAPYKIQFSDEIMNVARERSSNADTMEVLLTDDERGGFAITKKDLKYGQTSSHRVETTDRAQFHWLFALGLFAFAVWSLYYYKDRLIDTGAEKKLVKSFDAADAGTS